MLTGHLSTSGRTTTPSTMTPHTRPIELPREHDTEELPAEYAHLHTVRAHQEQD